MSLHPHKLVWYHWGLAKEKKILGYNTYIGMQVFIYWAISSLGAQFYDTWSLNKQKFISNEILSIKQFAILGARELFFDLMIKTNILCIKDYRFTTQIKYYL